MRVTCPACGAHSTAPDETATSPTRCPNCEAEFVPAEHLRRDPKPAPGTGDDGRSRALTVAGLLHFVYVALGLCLAVSTADVVKKFAPGSVSGMWVVGVIIGTALVAAVSGVGLLFRWKNAGYTALIVSAYFVLMGLLGLADGNLVGGAFWLATGGYIGVAVSVRWAELK
jgi:hypothetical protein